MNIDYDNKKMKYKTLYYDVTPISHRLPDDCLQIIAKYAYDKSQYSYLERKPRVCHSSWCISTGKVYQSCVSLKMLNGKFYRIRVHISTSGVLSYNVFVYDLDSNYKLCWDKID